jgi:hypothetical protein
MGPMTNTFSPKFQSREENERGERLQADTRGTGDNHPNERSRFYVGSLHSRPEDNSQDGEARVSAGFS